MHAVFFRITSLSLALLCLSGAAAQELEVLENSIGMKLVKLPAGKFLRGSPVDEVGSQDDECQHEVTLTRDFYIGVYEVTQSEYRRVMRENPSFFPEALVYPAVRHPETGRLISAEKREQLDGDHYPADRIAWGDAVRFCEKLSQVREEARPGRVYRLPTEAEWEYACRAGSTTAFSFGSDPKLLEQFGWFADNSGQTTHPVGERQPNAWGLYDMHGNVSEWCLDYHLKYPQESLSDPVGPPNGRRRVSRGGNWSESFASNCRSAHREAVAPGVKLRTIGFRVVMTVDK
jgi:formylglycine-generating enzyme required for sulfatase activity